MIQSTHYYQIIQHPEKFYLATLSESVEVNADPGKLLLWLQEYTGWIIYLSNPAAIVMNNGDMVFTFNIANSTDRYYFQLELYRWKTLA
jgi:hypothetical protein